MTELQVGRAELERLLSLERSFAKEGLTFDDVLLLSQRVGRPPNDVSTGTRVTRTIELAIPIVSAAMDTVTEARLAIALAREGGIGSSTATPRSRAGRRGRKVKRFGAGMIAEPVTLGRTPWSRPRSSHGPLPHLGRADRRRGGVLVGILTNRDLRFEDGTAVRVRPDDLGATC